MTTSDGPRRLRWYLAAPFDRRADAAALAREVDASARGWTQAAAWVDPAARLLEPPIPFDDPPSDRAWSERDIRDLRSADALVIAGVRSTGGGLWCELGAALALEIPVIAFLWAGPGPPAPTPIFMWHPLVEAWPVEPTAARIVHALDGVRRRLADGDRRG